MARPRRTLSESQQRQAESMAACGLADDDIAMVLGVSESTLKKYAKAVLKVGRAKGRARMGKAMFDAGLSGNVTAQIWWSKNQMGWSDKQQVETTINFPDIEAHIIGKDDGRKG